MFGSEGRETDVRIRGGVMRVVLKLHNRRGKIARELVMKKKWIGKGEM